MELEHRPDFESVRRRWEAFWGHENLDRPLFQIVVPRPGVMPVSRPYPVRPDMKVQPFIEQVLAWAATHQFLGDAVPTYTVEFAAEHFALLLGAELTYHDTFSDTGWVMPFVANWDDVELRFQRESYYWKRTVEVLQGFRERCDGRLIVSTPVLSAGLDALAAVRGTQELLVDLIERPEKVLRAQEQVRVAYAEIVSEMALLLDWDILGSTNHHGMYHPGWCNMIQCDFSTMIGPRMFRTFELPYLQSQAGMYDAVAYHVDGPQEIRHLEAICSLAGIAALQYTSLPRESEEEIDAVYARMVSMGMGVCRPVRKAKARRFWEEYKPRRCVFTVEDIETPGEAERFLESFQ